MALEGQTVESPKDAVKDPYVLEFLGLPELPSYSETELESRIIDHLQQFLLELGTGFAFVGRQERFTFDEEHFMVDLVFYNRCCPAKRHCKSCCKSISQMRTEARTNEAAIQTSEISGRRGKGP